MEYLILWAENWRKVIFVCRKLEVTKTSDFYAISCRTGRKDEIFCFRQTRRHPFQDSEKGTQLLGKFTRKVQNWFANWNLLREDNCSAGSFLRTVKYPMYLLRKCPWTVSESQKEPAGVFRTDRTTHQIFEVSKNCTTASPPTESWKIRQLLRARSRSTKPL